MHCNITSLRNKSQCPLPCLAITQCTKFHGMDPTTKQLVIQPAVQTIAPLSRHMVVHMVMVLVAKQARVSQKACLIVYWFVSMVPFAQLCPTYHHFCSSSRVQAFAQWFCCTMVQQAQHQQDSN